MGREFELKFAATQETFAALADRWRDWTVIQMETTYYDTPDHTLSRRNITLRRRMENGVSVCTVKTPAGGIARGEWELECGDIHTAIPELQKLGCPENLQELTKSGIEAVCGAKFTRRATKIQLDQGLVELALDEGILLAGEKTLPIREVEVELKSGSEDAAVVFAKVLAAQYGLTVEPESKFRRAQKLREA